jgi:hypothetical protein
MTEKELSNYLLIDSLSIDSILKTKDIAEYIYVCD